MEPRLQAIMQANARLVRFAADDTVGEKKASAVRAALQAELDEECRRVLADLLPVAGAAGAGLGGGGGISDTLPSFLRYLLRGMDIAERTAMLESAREADRFVARLGGVNGRRAGEISEAGRQAKQDRRQTPATTQLPAVLAMLGGSADDLQWPDSA